MESATCTIYLAGKVPKGDDAQGADDWRVAYQSAIYGIGSFEFLDPINPALDEGEPELVFGHDAYLIKTASVVIVDASTRLGIGTAQEIMIAKYFARHVLAVVPPDSPHRRPFLAMHGRIVADWIHPFLYMGSDAIFDTVGELCHFLATSGSFWRRPAKGIAYIDRAIESFASSGFLERVD